jgi:hypothetical protein
MRCWIAENFLRWCSGIAGGALVTVGKSIPQNLSINVPAS